MSKQFSILTTDVDLQALEKVLRDSGDVELLADAPTEDDRGLRPLSSLAISPSQAGKMSLACYLVPSGLSQRIHMRRASPVKVYVDDQRSHLISFLRPYHDGRGIRRGRLYYQNWIVENDTWVPKNSDFCQWADRVMARIKRTMKYDKASYTYLGTDAAQRIANGQLTHLRP